MFYQDKHRNEYESNGVCDEDVVAGVGRVLPELGRHQHRRHGLLRDVSVVLRVKGRDIDWPGFDFNKKFI